jgi:hypothetical protein
MPVRIYDLGVKLGIDSKVILAKAKELGMREAKVPSSSLDKITAQYLEDELAKEHPRASALAQAVPIVPQRPAPITTISEPVRERSSQHAKNSGITIRKPRSHGAIPKSSDPRGLTGSEQRWLMRRGLLKHWKLRQLNKKLDFGQPRNLRKGEKVVESHWPIHGGGIETKRNKH